MITDSLTRYATTTERKCFVCFCKKCNWQMTNYLPSAKWLEIALANSDKDIITEEELKALNHKIVSEWIANGKPAL